MIEAAYRVAPLGPTCLSALGVELVEMLLKQCAHDDGSDIPGPPVERGLGEAGMRAVLVAVPRDGVLVGAGATCGVRV